jgi:adenosylhomocysteine nucleosidase
MIGILGALEIEVAALMRALDGAIAEETYGYRFMRGKLAGREVVIAKCGVGKVNAAICAQTMILTYAPELIINTGVAGSLSQELGILDIAVGTDAVQHDVDTTACGDAIGYVSTVGMVEFPLDARAVSAILDAAKSLDLKAIPARIASGDQFVYAKERKEWIVKTFDAAACDMESGAIAQVCRIAGVRCAVIRAISDSTDDDHAMEFAKFAKLAADNSIRVLETALATDIL